MILDYTLNSKESQLVQPPSTLVGKCVKLYYKMKPRYGHLDIRNMLRQL